MFIPSSKFPIVHCKLALIKMIVMCTLNALPLSIYQKPRVHNLRLNDITIDPNITKSYLLCVAVRVNKLLFTSCNL